MSRDATLFSKLYLIFRDKDFEIKREINKSIRN